MNNIPAEDFYIPDFLEDNTNLKGLHITDIDLTSFSFPEYFP
ncbi:MAG: hypothetical protein ACOC4M_12860 [Promethearchaeia archaeon]